MKWFRLLIALSLAMFGLLLSNAQENTTATPAPTKTPNAFPTTASVSSNVTDAPNADFSGTLTEPYNQDDLSVLVGNVQRPNGIVWFNDVLLTACNGDYTLYQIDAKTGETITLVFGIQNAHTMFAEATTNGYNVWIPDFETNKIMRIDQRRNSPREIASDNLDGPWGIAYLNENDFLVTNIRAGNIVSINREGESRVVLDGLRAPAGLVIAGDVAFVVNNGSARRAIEWFELDALSSPQTVSNITKPLVSGLQNASGLVLGADGYLYFTYALGTRGVIGRVKPSDCQKEGGCTNEEIEIVVYTDLQAPLAGLSISPDMRLFFHTIFRPELYWVDVYPQA
jgi:streptogramin lyase